MIMRASQLALLAIVIACGCEDLKLSPAELPDIQPLHKDATQVADATPPPPCQGYVPIACYPGPRETIGVGVCRYGVLKCLDNRLWCDGAITPKGEVCDLSGHDEDCDGLVNEDWPHATQVDIVFAVDMSGSMIAYLPSIESAIDASLDMLAVQYDLRAALAIFPARSIPRVDLRVPLSVDFAAIKQADLLQVSGGSEPSLDAIVEAVRDYPWRQDSLHVVVVFTDESPQSYTRPPWSVSQVSGMVQAFGALVIIFAKPGQFRGILTATHVDINSPTQETLQAIIGGVENGCLIP